MKANFINRFFILIALCFASLNAPAQINRDHIDFIRSQSQLPAPEWLKMIDKGIQRRLTITFSTQRDEIYSLLDLRATVCPKVPSSCTDFSAWSEPLCAVVSDEDLVKRAGAALMKQVSSPANGDALLGVLRKCAVNINQGQLEIALQLINLFEARKWNSQLDSALAWAGTWSEAGVTPEVMEMMRGYFERGLRVRPLPIKILEPLAGKAIRWAQNSRNSALAHLGNFDFMTVSIITGNGQPLIPALTKTSAVELGDKSAAIALSVANVICWEAALEGKSKDCLDYLLKLKPYLQSDYLRSQWNLSMSTYLLASSSPNALTDIPKLIAEIKPAVDGVLPWMWIQLAQARIHSGKLEEAGHALKRVGLLSRPPRTAYPTDKLNAAFVETMLLRESGKLAEAKAKGAAALAALDSVVTGTVDLHVRLGLEILLTAALQKDASLKAAYASLKARTASMKSMRHFEYLADAVFAAASGRAPAADIQKAKSAAEAASPDIKKVERAIAKISRG